MMKPSHEGGAWLHILVCAVEPSGDALGAGLMRALNEKAPGVRFSGCGGALMSREGLESAFPIDPFSIIGPVDAVKALPQAMKSAQQLADLCKSQKFDAAIMIDGWAFAKLAAQRIHKSAPSLKLYKYVAPQVWGSRPHRAKTLASLFDGVLTLFEFEPPWFEKEGVTAKFVGNAMFQAAMKSRGSGTAFRDRNEIGHAPLLAVLPGSRAGEINRLMVPFQQTVMAVQNSIPGLRVVIPAAPGAEATVRKHLEGWPENVILASPEERYEVYAAADVALTASGTASTELAINETPMVVAYKVAPLTAFWVRRVATVEFASMINIAAQKPVIPEFLQDDCIPEKMAATLIALFGDTPERRAQLEAFPIHLGSLGAIGPAASTLAAETILDWIGVHT